MPIRQQRDPSPAPGGAAGDLPALLSSALEERLAPDEPVRLTAVGHPEAALAVTDRRLLILREGQELGAATAEVEELPLEGLAFRLMDAPGNARLEWSPKPDAGPAHFEVPLYARARFREIAAWLNASARQAEVAGAAPGSASPAPAPGDAAPELCPQCGTALAPGGAWCPGCGMLTHDACWTCSQPLHPDWQVCPYCGTHASEPAEIPCSGCSRVVPRGHAYCVHCGALTRSLCSGCDRLIRRDWLYCPDCGSPTAVGRRRAAEDPDRETDEPEAEPPSTDAEREAEGDRLNAAGTRAYEDERTDEAINLFRRAARLVPDRPDYWVNLGVALSEKEDHDMEAFAAFQQALAVDPEDTYALLYLGGLYEERERRQEARAAYEKVIALAPDSREAREARENLENMDEL